MSYFIETNSIFYAIEVMATNTPFLAVRMFPKTEGGWKYEFHLDQMRKDLKLHSDIMITNAMAADYVYDRLKTGDLPAPVIKKQKMIADVSDWLHTHNKVMANLSQNKITYYKLDYLKKFAVKYYPHLEHCDTVNEKEPIVNALLTGVNPPKPKAKPKTKKMTKAEIKKEDAEKKKAEVEEKAKAKTTTKKATTKK